MPQGKTAAYAQLAPEDINKRLRVQLSALRMLHPKPDNVRFVPDEGVHFSWLTEQDSAHHKYMAQVFKAKDRAVMRRYFIESIEMSVKPAAAVRLTAQASPRPFIGDPPPLSAPLLLPTAPQRDYDDDIFNCNVGHARANSFEDEMQDQAQQFLDGLQLRPIPHPVPEAVELDTRMFAVEPTESRPPSSVASSIRSSRNQSPEFENATPAKEENLHVDEEKAMVMSPSPLPSPIPGLTTLPVRRTSVERSKAKVVPTLSHVQLAPKENDNPVVHELSFTLQEIRKEIEADLIKEQAILLALKNLDAPVTELVDPTPNAQNNFIAKVRVQMLKTELENMIAKRRVIEDSIKEIARERRPPFVSPALMDAFVGISRLSTHVLGIDD
ncbi:hypothetical protein MVEN_00248700 [Mycena venus]|uniref:Uncharacterized protein n=1 Tax=Mycena venus TaxID=2733690 RepID=A0A8H6Z2K6_9AGAR|nr:hypothetical protein MVEN_00248700 [Mycena venus]